MFYVSAFLCLGAFFIFTPLTSSTPKESKLISSKELSYIREHVVEDEMQTKPPVPWKAIATSRPVLAYVFNRASQGLQVFVNSSKLPTYMSTVLHIHPTNIGVLLSLLSVVNLITTMVSGYVSELLIQKSCLSRTASRKLFSSIGNFGRSTCIMLIPFAGCNVPLFITLNVMERLMGGCSSGGDIPVPSEMSKNFPATIYAISNTIITCFGFIAPYFAGVILQSGWSQDLITLWAYVFWFSSSISICGGIVFLVFGEAEIQPFDKFHQEPEKLNEISVPPPIAKFEILDENCNQ